MLRPRARVILLTAAVLIAALASLAQAEVIQRAGLRINFEGELTPRALPRSALAPVRVAFGAKIAAVNGKLPPQLRQITIAINRHGHFNPAGLPICTVAQIQPSTTADALRACGRSLVGEGSFSAKVLLPEQAPFPSQGKVFAFNGRYHGRPAILAHVFGTQPAPTSYTLPFTIRPAKGTYGTILSASLPNVTSQWGYVTGIQMTLGRVFRSHGKTESYLSASCPAPSSLSPTAPTPSPATALSAPRSPAAARSANEDGEAGARLRPDPRPRRRRRLRSSRPPNDHPQRRRHYSSGRHRAGLQRSVCQTAGQG